MSSVHEQHGAHAHHGPRTLPATLNAPPEVLSAWRTRALIVAAVFALLTIPFGFTHEGKNHILRAYLMGYMTCFGFAGGGLVLLMLQYVSGGKWGLLLRRPLEAMSRTLPLVALFFLPIGLLGKHLYQWMLYPDAASEINAYKQGWITQEQMLTANAKHAMLNPSAMWIEYCILFAILLTFMFTLNRWSLERDADPQAGTEPSFERWRTKFENLSGPGILIYVILLTMGAIVWIKSLDVTWYSSIWGLQFLVGQGYAVLALSIMTVILLSRYEPMKTLLRTTEQHDLGKFAFAFVMLNIYLTLDFVCHWLIPFCLLLSRDLKRNKTKLLWLTRWMIFARCVDMFWLIEPNFKDAAGNLHIAGNIGILAYITVPVTVMALWASYYLTHLMARPLVNVNDPHLEEILEPEHAH
jgi:hypothetical protein